MSHQAAEEADLVKPIVRAWSPLLLISLDLHHGYALLCTADRFEQQ